MPRIATSVVPLLATAAVALPLAAAPASAARLVTRDGLEDVYVRQADGSFSQFGPRDNADVVASAVRNADRRVHTSVRFDELTRAGDRTAVPVRLHVSTGRTYVLKVVVGPDSREGAASLLRYTGVGARTVRVDCPGLAHTVDYGADLVAASVPRRCLGSPTWVEHGGTVRTVDDEGRVFTDALLSGDPVNDLYSGRIRRG